MARWARVVFAFVLVIISVGCASRAPAPVAHEAPAPTPTNPPTHAAPIDAPLPAAQAEQVLVDFRVLRSESAGADAIVLPPPVIPDDAVLLTRLRTLATIGKPFACDVGVQETNARLTGTVESLDGGRYRASVNYIERHGLGLREIKSRIELPAGETRVISGLQRHGGQDLLVLTLGAKPPPDAKRDK